jgi:hypothetical protein
LCLKCDFTILSTQQLTVRGRITPCPSHTQDMFFSEMHSNPGPGILFVTSILGFSLGPCLFLFIIFLVIYRCKKKIKCQGRPEAVGSGGKGLMVIWDTKSALYPYYMDNNTCALNSQPQWLGL